MSGRAPPREPELGPRRTPQSNKLKPCERHGGVTDTALALTAQSVEVARHSASIGCQVRDAPVGWPVVPAKTREDCRQHKRHPEELEEGEPAGHFPIVLDAVPPPPRSAPNF